MFYFIKAPFLLIISRFFVKASNKSFLSLGFFKYGISKNLSGKIDIKSN